MTAPRLMVMAGGTGGHVFPALAVAKKLQAEGAKITWLGTKRGLEATVVPANDIAIEWVSVQGLRGKGAISLLLAPFKLLRAIWQSVAIIRRVAPDCILGFGGFVSGPGGIAAWIMRRKLVVHEQNAVVGLTNRYLAKIADRVLTGFPDVADLPTAAVWVGNPVRYEIAALAASSSKHEQQASKVLIIGGSQGAHSFNQLLPDVLAQLALANVSIWHQSGRGHSTAVMEKYQNHNIEAKVSEFIDDMASAYQWADLLVCRAGAMTIAECCAAGKPALLVPYPYSAGDHQVKNAQAMVAAGGAKILLNQDISDRQTVKILNQLLSDQAHLVKMGKRARSLYKPNALDDVVQVCQECLHA